MSFFKMSSIGFMLLNLFFFAKNLKLVFKERSMRYFDRLGAKGIIYGIFKSVVMVAFVHVLSVSLFFHFWQGFICS